MSGEDLVARSRERTPGLRAIIASGYPYEPREAGVEFLQKPFLPNLLAQAIERALKA
jgi:DNA-binding NtrC family response regulator